MRCFTSFIKKGVMMQSWGLSLVKIEMHKEASVQTKTSENSAGCRG